MNIIGFYHICKINHWKSVVEEQINKIYNSGLYDKTDVIYVSSLGEPPSPFLPIKYKIIFESQNIKLCEMPILNEIRKISKNKEFYIWYIHTKGVHSSVKFGKTEMGKWRNFLEHFIIGQNEDCCRSLDNNYDCCGVSWQCSALPYIGHHCYYSGNFWWAKSTFTRNLPIISFEEIKNSRWIAEAWLGKGNPHARNLFKSEFVHPRNFPTDYINHKIHSCIKLI